MLKRYFKIASRSLWNNKVYSFINLIGLALGLAISILILFYVQHEFSYDNFHVERERIFRLTGEFNHGEATINTISMGAGMGPAVAEDQPEVAGFTRFYKPSEVTISNGNEKIKEKSFLFADSSLFSIFSFPLKVGNPISALAEPFSLVLTEASSQKYFGKENPLGKVLKYNNKYNFKITGVAENPPSNSSIDFDFLASFESLKIMEEEKGMAIGGLGLGAYPTYLLLNSPFADQKVASNIKPLYLKHTGFELEGANFALEPLPDTHLHSKYAGVFSKTANIDYLYVFLSIALLVLVIALINYFNLSTARATIRAKEVGVRKVVGASRRQIVNQFLVESVLLCTLAFLLSVMLVQLGLPLLNNLVQTAISSDFIFQASSLITLASLFIGVCLLSGFYPAWVLSAFKPTSVLKGKFTSGVKGATLRKVLVGFQFTLFIGLVAATIVIDSQVQYLQNKHLGLNKERVLAIKLDETLGQNYDAFKGELLRQPQLVNVSIVKQVPTEDFDIVYINLPGTEKEISLSIYNVDEDFFKTLQIPLTSSLFASPHDPFSNKDEVILNEKAIEELQLKDPIGKELAFFGGEEKQTVIGISENFHFESFYHHVRALAIRPLSDLKGGGYALVRVGETADLKNIIKATEDIHNRYLPDIPYDYFFLDDAFDQQYKAEDRLSKVFFIFTGMAILVSCLGLFGLVAFMSQKRVQEIGIRKVLGASVGKIAWLLSKDFLKVFLYANILSLPFVWIGISKWLQQFPYKVNPEWWMFALAGLIAAFVALMTIGAQTIKAALANPVDSLKDE